jgi:hypothetical protein
MTTRRLRLAMWQQRRSLKRQALVQESAAAHLIGLANTLVAVGRPEPAQRLVGIALRFRVKAICLDTEFQAVDWRHGPVCQRSSLHRGHKCKWLRSPWHWRMAAG